MRKAAAPSSNRSRSAGEAKASRRAVGDELKPLRSAGNKKVLGWKESVVLPDLGNIRLPAKLDTGARTSALHAVDMKYSRSRSTMWIEFDLPDIDQSRRHRFRLPVAEHRTIRSSTGTAQIRPVVILALRLAGQVWATEVTLTDRSDMELPMLIGRSALKGKFVVDPARTRLAGPISSTNHVGAPVRTTVIKKPKSKPRT
ncbi:ATP-dependent zinc protease [Dokdonella sp.]|uniref:ATP-dependent zinc protease family protein n=1 Tax=Dokdonella sp. TaxID=2291710 RepID=UPI003527423D